MGQAGNIILAAITGLIGLALVATVLSKNAQTAGVLQAGGSAFAQDLSAATAPVTGASTGGFTLNTYQPLLGIQG